MAVVLTVAARPGLMASDTAFDGNGRHQIPVSPQRSGDPERGRDYLISGDYLRSGIPLALYRASRGHHKHNELGRTGDNATLPPSSTAVTAPNGQVVVTANCLSCHGQMLRGEFILGLGNSLRDFTGDSAATARMIDQTLRVSSLVDPAPREAFAVFRDVIQTVSPHIRTRVVGVNPAVKLAYVLAAHRDPVTLRWNSEPVLPLPPEDEVVPSDVPAWWLMKKKNALYYNGMGRGDFARSMMASSLLTMQDHEEAAEIDQRFTDVLAFLQSLEPPKFPGKVDAALSAQGRAVFNKSCATCHGHYDRKSDYPNLLIHVNKIGTDPELARAAAEIHDVQVDAYNHGWFGQGEHAARMEPLPGYIAPPLDGVWATAPYLHNGSVPTLEALLDSSLRPRFWSRSFSAKDYDLQRVGWKFKEESKGGDTRTYDTTLRGYSNEGHWFGDKLSEGERRAVLEYLKTL
jgi:mono/diheme cytochrome c family protein